jgi:hypothetical protein
VTMEPQGGTGPAGNRFNDLYRKYSPGLMNVRESVSLLAEKYSSRAKSIGYVPLTGLATVSGLTGLLLASRDGSGNIDPAKLPDRVQEAFALQFPNKFEAGDLATLNETSIEPLMSGWVGKYAEILARDKLNSGESLGGYKLQEGDVARLASDPTQEGWDIIAEPSGQLFQVKATNDFGYIRNSANSIEDDGIIFISTDLADSTNLSELDVLLLEMDSNKDEISALIEESVDDAVDGADDFGILEDLLGPLALVVSAGTGAVLVKKAYDEYRIHGSMAAIRRQYGSRMTGKIIAMISPVPFSGMFVRKWIDSRMLLADALNTARLRLDRVSRLIASLGIRSAP